MKLSWLVLRSRNLLSMRRHHELPGCRAVSSELYSWNIICFPLKCLRSEYFLERSVNAKFPKNSRFKLSRKWKFSSGHWKYYITYAQWYCQGCKHWPEIPEANLIFFTVEIFSINAGRCRQDFKWSNFINGEISFCIHKHKTTLKQI